MKKLVVLFTSFMLFMPRAESQEATMKPYGIKSGIIEYTYSGDKTGTGTLYFDEYGMKSAMYMKTVSDGEESTSWVLTSGNYQYMWDPDQPDDGMKMKNPLISWIQEASKGDIESFTEETYLKMGMLKSGTELCLGKECTVIKGKPGKVLIWNGIMMLSDFKMGTYVSHQEATSVKTNLPVDAKYFILPKNIVFSEMPEF